MAGRKVLYIALRAPCFFTAMLLYSGFFRYANPPYCRACVPCLRGMSCPALPGVFSILTRFMRRFSDRVSPAGDSFSFQGARPRGRLPVALPLPDLVCRSLLTENSIAKKIPHCNTLF